MSAFAVAQTTIVAKSGSETTYMLLSNTPTMTLGESITISDGTQTKVYSADQRVVLFVKHNTKIVDQSGTTTERDITSGGSLAINDSFKKLDITEDISNMSLTYSRTFSNTCWQAWYMPFDVDIQTHMADFDVAQVNQSQSSNEAVVIDKLTSGTMTANTPYFIRLKEGVETGDKTITTTGSTLKQTQDNKATDYSGFSLTGIYTEMQGQQMIDKDVYALSGGKFCKAKTSAAKLGVFRFYMTADGGEEIKIRLSEDATGISDVDDGINADVNANADCFNLAGQVVDQSYRGLVIKAGKKYLQK